MLDIGAENRKKPSSRLFTILYIGINSVFAIGGLLIIWFFILFDETCNNVAAAYFCVLSLTGWLNIGLPVDKMLNVKDVV